MRAEDQKLLGRFVDILTATTHADEKHVAAIRRHLNQAIHTAYSLHVQTTRAHARLRAIQEREAAAIRRKVKAAA